MTTDLFLEKITKLLASDEADAGGSVLHDIAYHLGRIADSLEALSADIDRIVQPSGSTDRFHVRVLDIGRD